MQCLISSIKCNDCRGVKWEYYYTYNVIGCQQILHNHIYNKGEYSYRMLNVLQSIFYNDIAIPRDVAVRNVRGTQITLSGEFARLG